MILRVHLFFSLMLFLVFVLIGVIIFKDFGIGIEEHFQRSSGFYWLNYLLQFTELDINFLDVDFLRDLLEVIEEADALGEQEESSGSDRLVDRGFGLQGDNQFNILPDVDGKVFFLRVGTNYTSLKIKKGSAGIIEVRDKDLGDTVMCLNNCEGIRITITQQ